MKHGHNHTIASPNLGQDEMGEGADEPLDEELLNDSLGFAIIQSETFMLKYNG